jgi:CubicO group peptidase (beta-lactamase class C family)
VAATISGVCDPRFRRVQEAFAANFAARGEIGAAVCVYHGGRAVVDLWGGFRDAARSAPWGRGTRSSA